jgi:hypothetical protein
LRRCAATLYKLTAKERQALAADPEVANAADLADYENKAKEAVKAFWGNHAAAVAKQKELGREDQGERAGVTAGKNMDGFIALIQDVIRANGLTDAHMMMERKVLSLQGA